MTTDAKSGPAIGQGSLHETPRPSAPSPRHDLQKTKPTFTDLVLLGKPGAAVQVTGNEDPGEVLAADVLCRRPKAQAMTLSNRRGRESRTQRTWEGRTVRHGCIRVACGSCCYLSMFSMKSQRHVYKSVPFQVQV